MSVICAVCTNIIFDQYYVKIKTSCFHEECLTCSICSVLLQDSCFVREGHFFCKPDYDRYVRTRNSQNNIVTNNTFSRHCRHTCAKCKSYLYPEDMIYKENAKVYHFNCLTCLICGHNFRQGDEYIYHKDEMVCKGHVDDGKLSASANSGPAITSTGLPASQRNFFHFFICQQLS